MSLLFSMLSRLVIAFLPRSKHLLISWLQSPSAVILEPPKIKSLTVSIVSPSICHHVMGLDAMVLVFWMLSLKPTFSLSSFTFIKRLFSFSFCHKGGVILEETSSCWGWGGVEWRKSSVSSFFLSYWSLLAPKRVCFCKWKSGTLLWFSFLLVTSFPWSNGRRKA